MRKMGILIALCVALVASMLLVRSGGADDDKKDKPKHSIKEVMKQAHGKKLLNKVLGGDASDADKKKLLDLYISLVDARPKKGEPVAWLMKAGRLAIAAARVNVGRKGALAELKAASNCGACHKAHK